jgi:hypothetical protein
MMRAWSVLLAVVVTGAWLVLAPSRAGIVPVADHAGDGAQQSSVARAWRLTLSPAPDDLALAEIRFRGSGRERLTDRSLQVAVSGSFGADYLAVAVPRFRTPGGSRALVLLVNRPSPLMDPVSIQLRLSAQRSLGAPATWRLTDPFATHRGATHRGAAAFALCGLPLHGAALSALGLSALRSRGAPLSRYSPAGAIAQAYDVVCGLPYASSFKQAVEQLASAPELPPAPEPPSPSPPAPSPSPPVGKVPGEGCEPRPGYACPGALRSAVPGATVDGERPAAVGAH